MYMVRWSREEIKLQNYTIHDYKRPHNNAYKVLSLNGIIL